jgi:hypothetical protein
VDASIEAEKGEMGKVIDDITDRAMEKESIGIEAGVGVLIGMHRRKGVTDAAKNIVAVTIETKAMSAQQVEASIAVIVAAIIAAQSPKAHMIPIPSS